MHHPFLQVRAWSALLLASAAAGMARSRAYGYAVCAVDVVVRVVDVHVLVPAAYVAGEPAAADGVGVVAGGVVFQPWVVLGEVVEPLPPQRPLRVVEAVRARRRGSPGRTTLSPLTTTPPAPRTTSWFCPSDATLAAALSSVTVLDLALDSACNHCPCAHPRHRHRPGPHPRAGLGTRPGTRPGPRPGAWPAPKRPPRRPSPAPSGPSSPAQIALERPLPARARAPASARTRSVSRTQNNPRKNPGPGPASGRT